LIANALGTHKQTTERDHRINVTEGDRAPLEAYIANTRSPSQYTKNLGNAIVALYKALAFALAFLTIALALSDL
jgi:hypothetical protein